MKKVRYSTLWLTYTGVLIALQIVLGNLVQVALLEKQMNLGFLPIAAAGYLFGPVSAMIVAATVATRSMIRIVRCPPETSAGIGAAGLLASARTYARPGRSRRDVGHRRQRSASRRR